MVGYLAAGEMEKRSLDPRLCPRPGGFLHRARHRPLVISLSGVAAAVAWVAPMAIGLALIEQRVARITHDVTTNKEGGAQCWPITRST